MRAAVLPVVMRDEHRPKQDLIQEITGLRKQVVDLKEAMTARRRVEDALRTTESLLRSLTDGAPVGLCLFRRDGTLLSTNRPFARLLGYESPAELQAVGGVLGIFASQEEQARVFASLAAPQARLHRVLFRQKDGCRRSHAMLAAESEPGAVALVVFEEALGLSQ
jgi:PAS domain S-box-containing protein